MAATLATRLHAHFAPLHDRPTPDADLLARYALHGDSGAFASLVARHGGMVAAVCRKRLGHAHDAEDAAQAVFLALARKASRVHGTAPVAAWLYGAAVKACREVARRNRRKPWVPLTADVPGDSALSADHDAVAALLDEVAHLSDTCRAAVVLCELEGCPRALAASRLGIAEGTLSSRLAAARRRLAERLTRRGFAPSALAALAGLAVGGPSFAFDIPSVTPFVQRITEAIVTTSLAWKLKLLTALGATGVSLGLVFAGGEGPKPVPPAKPAVVAKAAEPSFVFATFTQRVERAGPRRVEPAAVAVWTLSSDGVLGASRSMGLVPTRPDEKPVAADAPDAFPPESLVDEVSVSVSPDAQSLTFVATRDGNGTLGEVGVAPNGSTKHDTYLAKSSGVLVRLGESHNDIVRPFWSPDSGTIYHPEIDWRKTPAVTSLFRLPEPKCWMTRIDVISGQRERVAIDGNTRPLAVSPDGKTMIGWVSHDSLFTQAKFRLCMARLPGGAAQHLGKWSPLGFSEAVFSPDGRRAVVTRQELVPYPKDLLATGSSLTLYHARRFDLVDLAAGTVTPFVTQPTAVPDYGRGVRWSPDGKRVAFTDAKGWSHGSAGVQVVEPCVVTCDPDGKNPAKVVMPTPKPVGFRFTGYGPQFVAWK